MCIWLGCPLVSPSAAAADDADGDGGAGAGWLSAATHNTSRTYFYDFS